jgi:hypothetical protein
MIDKPQQLDRERTNLPSPQRLQGEEYFALSDRADNGGDIAGFGSARRCQKEERGIDSAFLTRILADSAFRRARLSSTRAPPSPPRPLDFPSHITRENAARSSGYHC